MSFLSAEDAPKTFGRKPLSTQKAINQALAILHEFGLNVSALPARRRERLAMTLLALADVAFPDSWHQAKDVAAYSLKTRDIINVWNEYFGDAVSSGSYDDVRREDIKRLEVIGLVVGSAEASARNNPTRGYGIEPAVASAIRSFGTNEWAEKAHHIQVGVRDRISQLERSRTLAQTNVTLPSGLALSLTPGAHNDLQRAIIEDFLPRYGYESQILYIGDAANKNLFVNNPAMATLQLPPLNHGELPDIIAYSSLRKWLYFIEAVTSFGPMDSVRRQRLATYARHATVGIIYVTAFPDRQVFRKFVADISWETEVWIASEPDHIIHFNGERFLGPYDRN